MISSSSCPDDLASWLGPLPEYNPAAEEYQDMLHLIAYDIKKPRRLRKVAAACLDYGIRVEYSVFECDLSETLFAALWRRLMAEIDPTEDKILAYRICGGCVAHIQSMGVVRPPGRPLLYIL